MFDVILVTYVLYATGLQEVSREPMAPMVASLNIEASQMDLCKALKHQREFTFYSPAGSLGAVFVCKEVW